MNFGEKLKTLRSKKNLTQADISEKLGVSLRAVRGWESGNRLPRDRAIFYKLAEILECDVNYLLTEEDAFVSDVSDSYGAKSGQQARDILDQAKALFAGGAIPEEDQLQFLTDLQTIYLDSKQKAKKFSSKKKTKQ